MRLIISRDARKLMEELLRRCPYWCFVVRWGLVLLGLGYGFLAVLGKAIEVFGF